MMSGNLTSEGTARLKLRYYRLGASRLVAGVLSLIIPLFSILDLETFIGIIFLLNAIPSGWNAFQGFRDGDGPWQQTFVALVALAAGLVFLFHPLAEIIMLNVFLAIFFFVDGTMKVMEFWRLYSVRGSFWILIAGIFEIASSLMLWSGLWGKELILGVIFGVNLIITGIVCIILAKSCNA